MVEVIGVITVIALSWLLAFSMANECESEKRRRASSGAQPDDGYSATGATTKHAA